MFITMVAQERGKSNWQGKYKICVTFCFLQQVYYSGAYLV